MAGQWKKTTKLDREHAQLPRRHPQRDEAGNVAEPRTGAIDTLVVIISVFIFAAYFKIVDTILTKTVVAAESALVKQ